MKRHYLVTVLNPEEDRLRQAGERRQGRVSASLANLPDAEVKELDLSPASEIHLLTTAPLYQVLDAVVRGLEDTPGAPGTAMVRHVSHEIAEATGEVEAPPGGWTWSPSGKTWLPIM